MRRLLDRIFGSYLERTSVQLVLLLVVAAALQLAGGAGAAEIAGFSAVEHVLHTVDWPYLAALAGALVVSFLAYYHAYRGIYSVNRGPLLPPIQMLSVVVAGFGGFLAHGGAAVDTYALEAAGSDERDAKVRTVALDGMEHGIMSLIGEVAAILLLIRGTRQPPLDFQVPWATLPLPGFLLAFWLAGRYAPGCRDKGSWRGRLGIFLDAVGLIRAIFRHPWRRALTLSGMALFWLVEMTAGWLGLAAFHYFMGMPQFIVGFCTGMVFTRRTGPFAGAGVLELVLPLTLWASGAPLATAVVGIFAYRVVTVWLPVPFALQRLPSVRRMAQRPEATRRVRHTEEPALREAQ